MVSSNTPGRIIGYGYKIFVSLDENTLVADAARIMYERGVGSVIVTYNYVERDLRQSVRMITARLSSTSGCSEQRSI
jgi:hypothetical protein